MICISVILVRPREGIDVTSVERLGKCYLMEDAVLENKSVDLPQ